MTITALMKRFASALTIALVAAAPWHQASADVTAKDIVRIPMDRVKAQDVDIVSVPSKPTMPGGWYESTVDQPTEEAVAFVLSRMNSKAKLKRIVGVKKQVVNGMNYDITFELDNNTLWNVIVYRSLSGEFSIRKKAQKLE